MTIPLDDSVLLKTLAIAVDAIICADESHHVIFFNEGAETIFGYRAAEIIGQPLERLLPPRARQTHVGHLQKLSGTQDSARRMGERSQISGLRKDGTEFPAEASIAHVATAQGVVYSVVLRDITDRRRFEELNTQLVHDLQSAVTARDEMLGIVSHDLRNPVNAVKMLAAAILRTGHTEALPKDVSDHADVMLQAARQMDALIQDLLDVSRIESGRMQLQPRVVGVNELVSQATETLSPLAAQAGVTVTLTFPDRLPQVDVDPDRIVQVLSNLIGNAIKYTPRGGSVRVEAEADQDIVRVTVTDTGIGISEQELPRVFDRFWQSKRTNRSGAGLGLAIARGIVRSHGGRIWIESVANEGTTVHFTVPRAGRAPSPSGNI
jgi:PAS domain S-box-containing protein